MSASHASLQGFLFKVLLATLLSLAVAPVAALGNCPKTSLADLEAEVMCPICGTTLALSTSPQAMREKAFILAQVRKCKSKAQIKSALVAQYGQQVLALPNKKGFNLAVWLVPGAVIALALILIAAALIRMRKRRATLAPAVSSSSDDRERVDIELKKLDP